MVFFWTCLFSSLSSLSNVKLCIANSKVLEIRKFSLLLQLQIYRFNYSITEHKYTFAGVCARSNHPPSWMERIGTISLHLKYVVHFSMYSFSEPLEISSNTLLSLVLLEDLAFLPPHILTFLPWRFLLIPFSCSDMPDFLATPLHISQPQYQFLGVLHLICDKFSCILFFTSSSFSSHCSFYN